MMFLLNNAQLSDFQVAYRSLLCRATHLSRLLSRSPTNPDASWSSMVAQIAWSLGTSVCSVTITASRPSTHGRSLMRTSDQAALERIKASHALDAAAARLANFYRGWARSYDSNVGREEYRAAGLCRSRKRRADGVFAQRPCSHGNPRRRVRNRPRRWADEAPRAQVPDGFESQMRWSSRLGKFVSTSMSKAMSISTGPRFNYPSSSTTPQFVAAFSRSGMSYPTDCANRFASPFERLRYHKNSQSYATEHILRRVQRMQKVASLHDVLCNSLELHRVLLTVCLIKDNIEVFELLGIMSKTEFEVYRKFD